MKPATETPPQTKAGLRAVKTSGRVSRRPGGPGLLSGWALPGLMKIILFGFEKNYPFFFRLKKKS